MGGWVKDVEEEGRGRGTKPLLSSPLSLLSSPLASLSALSHTSLEPPSAPLDILHPIRL